MRGKEEPMFLIFVAISFVYLSIKFYALAIDMDWCFEKIVASAFVVMAILSFFVFVIIESVVFNLLPLAFILVAIDLLSKRGCSESIGESL